MSVPATGTGGYCAGRRAASVLPYPVSTSSALVPAASPISMSRHRSPMTTIARGQHDPARPPVSYRASVCGIRNRFGSARPQRGSNAGSSSNPRSSRQRLRTAATDAHTPSAEERFGQHSPGRRHSGFVNNHNSYGHDSASGPHQWCTETASTLETIEISDVLDHGPVAIEEHCSLAHV